MDVQIEHSKLRAELFHIANELVEDGFTVYYLPTGTPALQTWLIFGKADDNGKVNTGTVELADFGAGVNVSASIRPSRQYGSSLAMWLGDPWQGYKPGAPLDACRAAAQPVVRNFLHVDLANDGIEHFAWCADRLVHLVGAE